ncbi:MAG: hypothetical protein JNN03_07005 [Rubrivivax sp.]|nr:hypothetical protein [Rubrivivax sp.]
MNQDLLLFRGGDPVAADLAAAEVLALGCPVLGHGGSVEVRASWVMNGSAP